MNVNGMIVGDNVGINCDISSDGSCFLVKGSKGTNTTGQSYAWFKIFEFKSRGGVTKLGQTLEYPRSEFESIDQASLNATGDRLLIGNQGHETTTNDLGWGCWKRKSYGL